MKKKGKKRYIIGIVITGILDFCAFMFLFFAYGPVDYFRNLLVTTAMTTQSHKYLARTLYSEEQIEAIVAENTVEEFNEDTNVSDIQIGQIEETEEYSSIYEEQILTREENQLYKIIPLEEKYYKGFLVVIYDPSRVSLITSRYYGKKGQMLEDMAKYHNTKVAINASGFADYNQFGNGAVASGISIQDGKLISGEKNRKGKLIGFNNDHVLVLTNSTANEAIANGIRDAVEFGPFLIVNGKEAEIKGNGGWGIAPRTAIGQRKDGIVLFVVVDGRQPGYSVGTDMKGLISIFKRYKAYNAANLDGGASSSLNIEGKLYSKPCAYSNTGERYLPNAWALK